MDLNGKLPHDIAYASRLLTSAESKYSVTHLELLAVVWALQHFRDIIFGYPVTVYTDHIAVTQLFHGKNRTGRLARWYHTIQQFEPTLHYLPGKANTVADALSRNIPVPAVAQILNFSSFELHTAQCQDTLWFKVIYSLESGDDSTSHNSTPFSFHLEGGRALPYGDRRQDPGHPSCHLKLLNRDRLKAAARYYSSRPPCS